jgi:hypothetical protein
MICALFPVIGSLPGTGIWVAESSTELISTATGQKIVGKISSQHLVAPVESPIIAITSNDSQVQFRITSFGVWR